MKHKLNINNSLKNYTFIDLFAGIGGFHHAFKHFNAKCVFSSEWDRYAANVYKNNFGIAPYGDITKIDVKDIPQHDILCGGFPCQAFSVSGKQKGFDDIRGTLFFDIARIVEYHKPKIIFLENVKNLAKHDNGRTFKVIEETLKKLSYNTYYKILNASDFGLPQNRERIFIVCFRSDLEIKSFDFPTPLNKKVALIDFLEELPEAKVIKRNDVKLNKEGSLPKDKEGNIIFPNRPIQIGYVNKGGQGERIYSIYGHACTLSAYGGGVGSKTGIYKVGNVLRKLSPRECARIQGFPDNFVIDETKSQAYKQFGNSVAVNVLKEIITKIVNVL
jgi:DNA (cytosine-5)-methyltransferase 1